MDNKTASERRSNNIIAAKAHKHSPIECEIKSVPLRINAIIGSLSAEVWSII